MNFDTIATLKTTPGNSIDKYARVWGYHQPGDGGGGEFYWNAESTASDDQGMCFQVASILTGRWERVSAAPISLKYFGAKGDGSADDTNAFILSLNYLKTQRKQMFSPYVQNSQKVNVRATLRIPDGHYIVAGDIYIPRYVSVKGDSREGTIIQCKNQNKHVFRLESDTSDNFDQWTYAFTRLKNFTVAGKHFATNPFSYHMDIETRGLGCGIYLKDRIKVSFENIRCSGFEDAGIRIDNSYYLPMTQVQCDTNLAGLTATNSTTTIQCSKSVFSHNSIGITINNSFSNSFESCSIESNTANFLPYPLAGSENNTENTSGQGIVIRESFNNTFSTCYIEENIVNVTMSDAKNNSFDNCLFCPSNEPYNTSTYITPVFLSFYGGGNVGNKFEHNHHVDTILNTNDGRNVVIRSTNYGKDILFLTCNKEDYDKFKNTNSTSWQSLLSSYPSLAPTLINRSTGHEYRSLTE